MALGDAIVQPPTVDVAGPAFAKLKRYVTLTSGFNQVDAAIAQLDDQTNYTVEVVGGDMRPISTTHPAAGMALAWDPQGDTFLSRMDLALEQLNCELLPGAGAVSGVPRCHRGDHTGREPSE